MEYASPFYFWCKRSRVLSNEWCMLCGIMVIGCGCWWFEGDAVVDLLWWDSSAEPG